MDIIYSHVKEPIRKGATPAEVFLSFMAKINAAELPAEEKQETIVKLRLAVGLAWDEVRPIALMNRNAAAREEAKERAEVSRPTLHDGY
jgi:hypothetical protein